MPRLTATAAARIPVHTGGHVCVVVRLPDRPGALGSVASRMGAVGADITHVAISRSEEGTAAASGRSRKAPPMATDEFHLDLPPASCDPLALLQRELCEVDGTEILAISAVDDCPTCR